MHHETYSGAYGREFSNKKVTEPKSAHRLFYLVVVASLFSNASQEQQQKKKRKEQCSLLHAISFNRFPLLLHLFPLFLFFFFVDTMYAAFSSSSYHIL